MKGKPSAYQVRQQMLGELYRIWIRHGGGDRDYYEAQGVWDSVRAKFAEGSVDKNLADRVFAGLQTDGLIQIAAEEGNSSIGIRLTEAGRAKFEDKRQLDRNAWLAYIGAGTGILGLIISIATEAF